jgi:hypothetical protein
MRYYELEQQEPQCGDIVGLELGDTLIEAVISEVLDDGVVLQLDETAVNLMIKANKQKLNEKVDNAKKRRVDPDEFNSTLSKMLDKDVAEPETTPTPPPETKPEAPLAAPEKNVIVPSTDTTFKTMGDCKNAIDWGIGILRKLSPSISQELISAGNDTVIAYLKLVARRTGADIQHSFNVDDFKHCEDYLSSALEDSNVSKWVDVLRTGGLNEAKYHGRKVPLGKPMAGDVKKSKVYVKGPKGKVVKVNFGDPNMRIKKSSPAHRKSFRARHNCDNPGPRWKARYWSCRAW